MSYNTFLLALIFYPSFLIFFFSNGSCSQSLKQGSIDLIGLIGLIKIIQLEFCNISMDVFLYRFLDN